LVISLPRKVFCPRLRRFAAFTSRNYHILRSSVKKYMIEQHCQPRQSGPNAAVKMGLQFPMRGGVGRIGQKPPSAIVIV
jgi:hypothetical protein